MKLSNNQLKIFSIIFFVLGAIINTYTYFYNKNHPADPNSYGRYLSWVLFIVAMFFLMPWNKQKK